MSKKIAVLLIIIVSFVITKGQTTSKYNPITTGVPFLTIAPDARHGAMGDVGAATEVDANDQFWNPSKLAFAKQKMGVSLSYTPWLSKLVNDINLIGISGFVKLDNMQSVGSSVRYFTMGNIQLNDNAGIDLANVKPSDLAFDVSYSRILSTKWSGSVAFRYIHSNLSGGYASETYQPGNAIASDVSFFFNHKWQSERGERSISTGANISNIGTKISYNDGYNSLFLPTNMRVGTTYSAEINKLHNISISLDFNKLLVPSNNKNGDGSLNNGADKTVLEGIFSSFSDAPGGFSEELHEVNISTGIEYQFRKQLAIRTGYFYENKYKGNRSFFSSGVGFKLKLCTIDVSYLLPTQTGSPLENSVKISLLFDENSFSKNR